jgi:hypothetical protein
MAARRLLIIVAVLMGVTALTAGLTAPPRGDRASLLPALDPAGPPASPATLVERTLRVPSRRLHTVAVDQGDQLRLTVQSDALDAVELVGLGQVQALAPQSPAVFDVLADEAGSYPVVLTGSARRVAVIRVTPAQE